MNRFKHFVISILQNSKLNREKFVNNKKKINIMDIKKKNHNMIIKRNFSSSSTNFTLPPNNNPKLPNFPIIAIICGTFLMMKNEFDKKK
jgi:hypothetical protein